MGRVVALAALLAVLGIATGQTPVIVSTFDDIRAAAASTTGPLVLQLLSGNYTVAGPTVVFTQPSSVQMVGGSSVVFKCADDSELPFSFTKAGTYSFQGLEWKDCRNGALQFDLGAAGSSVTITSSTFDNVTSGDGAVFVQGEQVSLTVADTTFKRCNGMSNPTKFNVGNQDPVGAHAVRAVLQGAGNSLVISNTVFEYNGLDHVGDTMLATVSVACTAGVGASACAVGITGGRFDDNYATFSAGAYVACDGSAGQRCDLSATGTLFRRNDMQSGNVMSIHYNAPAPPNFEPSALAIRSPNTDVTGLQTLTVKSCQFLDQSGGSAVRSMMGVKETLDVTISDCVMRNITVLGMANAAIGLRLARYVTITNIIVDNCNALLVPELAAMGFTGTAGGTVEVWNWNVAPGQWTADSYTRISKSLFTNNSVAQIGGSAIWITGSHNVEVTDSKFFNNSGAGGASCHIGAAIASPYKTYGLFERNWVENSVSMTDGGALQWLVMESAIVSNCTFKNNLVIPSYGAGIAIATNVGLYAGAIDINTVNYAEVKDTLFIGNTAPNGGAIQATTCPNVIIHRSTFEGNEAIAGSGGCLAVRYRTSVTLIDNMFRNNVAQEFGGAVYVISSRIAANYNKFAGNIAAVGGAIATVGGAQLDIDMPWFLPFFAIGNFKTASPTLFNYYSAIPRVDKSSVFEYNKAYSGGAISVQDGGLQVAVQLAELGHVYQYLFDKGYYPWEAMLGPTITGEAANTTFRYNQALTGGAITLQRPVNGVQFYYTTLENNVAHGMGEGFTLPVFQRNIYGMAPLDPETAALVNGCGAGNGGGVCFVGSALCGRFEPQVLASIRFSQNIASYGGGMYIGAAPDLCANADDCFALYLTGLVTIEVGFNAYDGGAGQVLANRSTVSFDRNEARGGAGGAIYMQNLGITRIFCDAIDGYDQTVNATIAKLDPAIYATNHTANYVPCGDNNNPATSSWYGNKATQGAFGDVIASTPVTYTMQVADAQLAKSYPSGENLAISIKVYDLYGNEHMSPIINHNNASLVEVMVEDDETLGKNVAALGGYLTDATPANFSDFQVLGKTGKPRAVPFLGLARNLRRSLGMLEVTINVRQCRINEYSTRNGTLCPWCQAGYYNTNRTSSICTPCPDHATCVMNDTLVTSTNPVIVPDDEFWHSNAFSEQVYTCVRPEACTYPGRRDLLISYQAKLLEDTSGFNQVEYVDLMCAPGYTGLMCGSCAAGYGLDNQGICIECSDNVPLNTFLYVLMSCISLVTLMMTTRAELRNAQWYLHGPEDEEKEEQEEEGSEEGGSRDAKGASTSQSQVHKIEVEKGGSDRSWSPDAAARKAPPSESGISKAVVPVAEGMEEDRDTVGPLPRAAGPVAEANEAQDPSAEYGQYSHEVAGPFVPMGRVFTEGVDEVLEPEDAFGDFSATMKVFITYLQLLSIIRFIPLPSLVPKVFTGLLSASTVLISSPTAAVSLACSMPNNGVNPNIGSIIVVIAIPFIACTVVVLVFYTYSTGKNVIKSFRKGSEHNPRNVPFRLRVLVSIITAIFYFYESLVENFMLIFQCHDGDQPSGNQLAMDTGLYIGDWWTRDYSVRCFHGQHGTLTWALGIPGIVCFCILVPVFTAWWLGIHEEQLEFDRVFMSGWGFIYKEYKHDYYAWECAVMLEKLLLCAVMVLLSNTSMGNGMQVLAAVAVVTVSLLAHVLCRPYRKTVLQHLETMGQSTILVTLYLCLYFTYGKAPYGFRAIAAFLVIINLLAMATFVFFLFKSVVDGLLLKAGLDPRHPMPKNLRGRLTNKLRASLGGLGPAAASIIMALYGARMRAEMGAANLRASMASSSQHIKAVVLRRGRSSHGGGQSSTSGAAAAAGGSTAERSSSTRAKAGGGVDAERERELQGRLERQQAELEELRRQLTAARQASRQSADERTPIAAISTDGRASFGRINSNRVAPNNS